MNSSYIINNYADVFKAVVRAFQPQRCVELGVLDGYSTIAIAEALKVFNGHLDAWDLFDRYEFKHGDMAEVQARLGNHGLSDVVTLIQGDAFQAHLMYENNSVGLLHVDISNTGETFDRIMEDWDPKMLTGGMILFEGGSEERDQVEWMVKYNKPKIKPAIDNNRIVLEKYVYGTYLKYPSLTALLKKRD